MQTTIEIFTAVTTILSSFYLILIYVDWYNNTQKLHNV
jgi:hypothetical protein